MEVAIAYAAAGRRPAGEAAVRRALAIERRTLAPDHVAFVRTLTTLGRILIDQRRAPEARPHLVEAVRIAAIQLPERHSQRIAAERALKDAS